MKTSISVIDVLNIVVIVLLILDINLRYEQKPEDTSKHEAVSANSRAELERQAASPRLRAAEECVRSVRLGPLWPYRPS